MKTLVFSVFAVALLALAGGSAVAMDKMHGSMMMPNCPVGDPPVGVNMVTKMYMTHAQMKAKTAGMSASQVHAMMVKNHAKLMCMSKAKAMGAKMMGSSM